MQRNIVTALAMLLLVGCTPTPQTQTTALKPSAFNIPPLASNGSAAGFCVNAIEAIPAPIEITPSPTFRLAHDDRGLHVWVSVPDSTPNEGDDASLFKGDSVEIFVGRTDQPKLHYQLVTAPGRTKEFSAPRHAFYGMPKDLPNAPKLSADVSAKARADGYDLDVLLPWSNLNMTGATGTQLTFQLVVNDAAGDSITRFAWFPSLDASWNTAAATYRICLADTASPSVDLGITGGYQEFRRTVVTVNAVGSLAGKTVEVRDGSTVLGSGVLNSTSDGAAGARLLLPMPARDHPYPPLAVSVDGKPATVLTLPTLPSYLEALDAQPFTFRFMVFNGDRLPIGKFENPIAVEDIIGPYTVTTKYYDAKFNQVTDAQTPGRYGEIVEVHYGNHEVYRRYFTLYRTGEEFNWRKTGLTLNGELPSGFAVDPATARQQSEAIAGEFNKVLREAVRNNEDMAVLLAGLSEFQPDPAAPVIHDAARIGGGQFNPVFANDMKWWASLKRKLGINHQNYLIYFPKGYDPASTVRWPLIMTLHGSGAGGDDLNELRQGTGLPGRLEKSMDLPFIVLAPQSPTAWDSYDLVDLLDEIIAKYPVDPDRIYVCGESMGGYGTWHLAEMFPDRLAAIAPICGVGNIDQIDRIKDLPVWAFHGDDDPNVPCKDDVAVVDALKKIGGRVKMTIYHGVKHQSWYKAYADPDLYTWFLQQKRGQPAQPRQPNR